MRVEIYRKSVNSMLYRKIEQKIRSFLLNEDNKILIVQGARQIGKSYIIRKVCKEMFENYVEINFAEDKVGTRQFVNVRTTEDFYLQVSMLSGSKMDSKKNTVIFMDEIQEYPHLLTLLKFLRQEDRFTYIASGSLLGLALHDTTSIPIGSISIMNMYPLDFEEFIIANGIGKLALDTLHDSFLKRKSLDISVHNKMMDLFRKFLLVGGMPDAVNAFLETKNIAKIRTVQNDIHKLYETDASKYDKNNSLKIKRIYEMIPSNLENKKKRIVIKDIDGKKGGRFSNYVEEFDYLTNAGIALEVKAVSSPSFPLIESSSKNLLKLYLNDVGILTGILYGNNIRAIMDDVRSINLGSVYEMVVASELAAHGHKLYYYDNKSKGEVDFLVNDYKTLRVVPLEIKSGKDYTVHSSLNHFVENDSYGIGDAFVLSNDGEVKTKGKITYLPVYYIMFFNAEPELEMSVI